MKILTNWNSNKNGFASSVVYVISQVTVKFNQVLFLELMVIENPHRGAWAQNLKSRGFKNIDDVIFITIFRADHVGLCQINLFWSIEWISCYHSLSE